MTIRFPAVIKRISICQSSTKCSKRVHPITKDKPEPIRTATFRSGLRNSRGKIPRQQKRMTQTARTKWVQSLWPTKGARDAGMRVKNSGITIQCTRHSADVSSPKSSHRFDELFEWIACECFTTSWTTNCNFDNDNDFHSITLKENGNDNQTPKSWTHGIYGWQDHWLMLIFIHWKFWLVVSSKLLIIFRTVFCTTSLNY